MLAPPRTEESLPLS